MYICLCRGVTDVQIHNAIENGCDDYTKLRQELQVASQCGRCACEIKKMVNFSTNAIAATIKSNEIVFY